MGGVININDHDAWLASFGRYDHIVGRIEAKLRAVNEDVLLSMIEKAKEPYLRFLDLEEVDAPRLATFAAAVDSAYADVAEAGPHGFGAHPEVYDSFLASLAELRNLVRGDPRIT